MGESVYTHGRFCTRAFEVVKMKERESVRERERKSIHATKENHSAATKGSRSSCEGGEGQTGCGRTCLRHAFPFPPFGPSRLYRWSSCVERAPEAGEKPPLRTRRRKEGSRTSSRNVWSGPDWMATGWRSSLVFLGHGHVFFCLVVLPR